MAICVHACVCVCVWGGGGVGKGVIGMMGALSLEGEGANSLSRGNAASWSIHELGLFTNSLTGFPYVIPSLEIFMKHPQPSGDHNV